MDEFLVQPYAKWIAVVILVQTTVIWLVSLFRVMAGLSLGDTWFRWISLGSFLSLLFLPSVLPGIISIAICVTGLLLAALAETVVTRIKLGR